MIRRIRNRREFDRLARDGKRIRHAELWCSWCPDPTMTSTSIAFAIGRAVGPATTRNRLRRRLRSILTTIDRTHPLPHGLLLIGARPPATELTFDQLSRATTTLMDRLSSSAASS